MVDFPTPPFRPWPPAATAMMAIQSTIQAKCGGVIEGCLDGYIAARGEAHDADLGGIEAPLSSVLAHDFDGTQPVGGGHGANLSLGTGATGATSRGAGLGLGELLIGSSVGEAVLENEAGHAVPLEPVGHLRALGVPGEHAERASRRDHHRGSRGGLSRGKIDRDAGLDHVAHGFETGIAHSVLGLLLSPGLGAGRAVGP
jgi:hypothetical protein